jgi:hypothetical protein
MLDRVTVDIVEYVLHEIEDFDHADITCMNLFSVVMIYLL